MEQDLVEDVFTQVADARNRIDVNLLREAVQLDAAAEGTSMSDPRELSGRS